MIIEVAPTGGDDTAALEAACLAAVPGDKIRIGIGRAGTTRTLFPPCEVIGWGHGVSSLFALPGSGAAILPLLNFGDKSNVGVSDLLLEGNDEYPSGGNTTSAVMFGGYTVPTNNFRMTRCRLKNFHADNWVRGASLYTVKNTDISGNIFETKIGDGPVYANGSPHGGHLVALYGTTTGAFCNSRLCDNTIDGKGVAFGLGLYGSHRIFHVTGNQISNMGQATASEQNSHAIFAYGFDKSNNAPAFGIISGNIINGCASTGIYCATASLVDTDNNFVYGQSRSDDATLPRGGVVYNDVDGGTISGNDLRDGYCGLAMVNSSDILADANKIKSVAGGAPIGIRMTGTIPINTRSTLTNNDILLLSGSSRAFQYGVTGGHVVVRNNASRAATHGIADEHTATREIGGNTFFSL